jgi:hypothetical protein
MKKILLVISLLTLAFSSAQACEPCGEIKILPTQNLESCPMGESKTVEVIIYNPEYCYSNITDITLSDDVNFDLNRSFGDVPCGDASTFNMRGYQYCTVGLTFKPTTTSGTFSTDIQVTDRDTGVHSVTVDGKVDVCCHSKHKRRHWCSTNTDKKVVNYLENLNLIKPNPSTHVYVDNKTLVFDEYYEANEGLATIALDAPVNFLSRLTFDVNQSAGLFMPRLSGDDGSYYTTDIRKTNRYGFMFPAGKVLDELNFTTWGVGFTGVVSNLSLIEISDLNQSSVQENDSSCSSHRKHSHNLHKFCDRDFMKSFRQHCQKDFAKHCGKDFKRDFAKHCDRDFMKDFRKHCSVSHKSCNRDHKRDSHKTCDRDHKRDSHKTCDRDHKRDSNKSCSINYKRYTYKACNRD